MMVNNNKKNLLIFLSYLFCVALLYLFSLLFPMQNNRLADLLFRIRYAIKGAEEVSPDLVVFQLDDRTVFKYNITDSDRAPFAAAIRSLQYGGVKTLLLDILFRFPANGEGDELLIEAARDSGILFSPAVFKSSGSGPEIPAEFIIYPEKKRDFSFPVAESALLPFAGLLDAVRGIGGISPIPAKDGVVRKIPLLYAYKGGYLPSMVLAGICHYLDVPLNSLKLTSGGILLTGKNLSSRDGTPFIIPVDREGCLLINYAGPWSDSISGFSLEPLISGERRESLPGLLRDTIVLAADMTTGKKDFSEGIFDSVYPNSGVVSNALNTLLTGRFLKNAGFGFSLLFLLLIPAAAFLFHITAARFPGAPFWLLFVFEAVGLFIISAGYTLVLFILFYRIPPVLFFLFVLLVSVLYLYGIQSAYRKTALQAAVSLPVDQEAAEIPVLERFRLTPKEKETALLLLEGKLYKEIAILLGISEAAVKIRIHKIYTKCGVGNKIEFSNLVRGDH